MAELSAVIVSHNSADHLRDCISAVHGWADQVIVIDNASDDQSADTACACALEFERTTVVANRENRGFAGAVNQGVRMSLAGATLILNPDTKAGAHIDLLADAATAPGYGAAAGLLVDEEGLPQAGFSLRRLPTPAALAFEVLGLNRLWPSNPVNRRWRCHDLKLTEPCDVEQPAGAFLAIRREAWEAIGGFDESFYPIWFEDVDFCKRLADAGWRIRFVPEARACHSGAHSIRKMDWTDREVQWYVSLLRYAAKHFKGGGRAAVAASVSISSVPRAVVAILQRRSFEPLWVWGKVNAACLRYAAGRAFAGDGRISLYRSGSGE